MKFLVEISNNWPNDLLETNVYNTLEYVDKYCLQYYDRLILLQ